MAARRNILNGHPRRPILEKLMGGSKLALFALLLAIPRTVTSQSAKQGATFSGDGFAGKISCQRSESALQADRGARQAPEPKALGARSVSIGSNSLSAQAPLSASPASGDAIRSRAWSGRTVSPIDTDNGCEEIIASENHPGGWGRTERIETAAANGLNLVGTTSYVVSQGGIARLKAAEVRNSRNGSISGTLRLSLYFTLQPPVFGQTINGYQTAIYTLGQLQGGFSYFNVDSGSLAWSTPPDGTYYVTMTLDEFSGGQYGYQDFLTFSGTFTIGLSLHGNLSYSISGGTAELKADEVRNSRYAGISGTLRFSLYFTLQPPVSGQTITGYQTATYTLGQLAGGFSFFNVDSGTIPWSRPPDGTYYVTLTLDEFSGSGYFYEDFLTFSGTVRVGPPSPTCSSNATTLCLNGDRFAVGVTWTKSDGTTGTGQAIALTGDTGYFWFFSANNVEMVIKLVDGRALNSRFWAFAGGLTNVRVLITVTDTQTGAVRTYLNPQGIAFAPIQDTDAFAGATEPEGSLNDSGPTVTDPAAVTSLQLSRELSRFAQLACASDGTTLCLNNSRFRVQARWTTPDGRSGAGQAVSLTGDTGYFWFFSENNVEMVIKAVDGRAINSHYWVFAGGLTNVNVVITVTDTQTGAVKTYTNPQNVAFAPIQDTSAFLGP